MPTEKIVISNGIKLWTEGIGNSENPACLLISGAGAPAKFWSDEFCEIIRKAGYFVIRYDHRDQGLSDAVNWDQHPYTVKDLAEDAVNILDDYHIEKVHVVGHSMGGIIAQLLALNHPDRLLSFTSISVSTVGKASTPPKEVMDVLLENKPTQNFEKDLPGFMKSWQILNGTFALDKQLAYMYTQDFYIRSNLKVDVAWNHIRCQEGFTDLRQILPQCTVRGLFIHGELDPLMKVSGAYKTAKLVPHAELIVIPGMGHMFFNRDLQKQIATHLIDYFKHSNEEKPT